MKRTRIIGIIATTVLALFIACVKDLENEGIYTETELIGTVVEKSSNAPLPNVKVKITDGDHIHASAITDADGSFSLNVNFSEINKSYYLLLDGSPNLPTKQEQLHGFGNKVYDCKLLVLYDKTDETLLPQVTTGEVSNIMTTTATVSGTVSSNGGHSLTERGICYATHQSPTVDDMHSTAGAELGTFSCYLTGLQKNVTYYVRAYAINSIAISYGEQKSFTTTDGRASVVTTTPTKTGTTVVTGGSILDDGGYSVTVRGVCYGLTPYPDVSSAHYHTTDGAGSGTYSSTFVMNGTGVYYVRAYATNANGTSYGEQLTINHPYNDLPTFSFNGQTYRVAPPAINTMNWSDASSYCNNLTLYGYTDWRLPTVDELLQMYQDRNTIGGFNSNCWWSGTYKYTNAHYGVYFNTGNTSDYSDSQDSKYNFVRPIRIDN